MKHLFAFLLMAGVVAGQDLNLRPGSTIKLWDADGSHYLGLKAPTIAPASLTFTFPSTDGTVGQVLTTDGAGNWSWSSAGGGGGGVSDGDKGDIVVSASGATWLLDSSSVSLSQLGLLDPNTDKIAFWDDSAGALSLLTLGTGVSISGTTLNVSSVSDGDKGDITVSGSGSVWAIDTGAVGPTELGLADPNADRIFFWDDSAGQFQFLTISTGLSISGTNLINTMTGDSLILLDTSGGQTVTFSVAQDLPSNVVIDFVLPETDITATWPAASFSFAATDLANGWGDGVKQTFNPNGTNAGINVGSHTGNPSVLADGDMWYNGNTEELTLRINGNTVGIASTAADTLSFDGVEADTISLLGDFGASTFGGVFGLETTLTANRNWNIRLPDADGNFEFPDTGGNTIIIRTGTESIAQWTVPNTDNPLAVSWDAWDAVLYQGITGELDLPPVADYAGRTLVVMSTGTYTITVDPDGTNQIIDTDGVSLGAGTADSISASAGTTVTYYSDGARWKKFTGGSGVSDWSELTGTPTTLSGYGITDAQPIDSDLTDISALTTTAWGRQQLANAGTGTFSGSGSYASGATYSGTMSADADISATTLTSGQWIKLILDVTGSTRTLTFDAAYRIGYSGGTITTLALPVGRHSVALWHDGTNLTIADSVPTAVDLASSDVTGLLPPANMDADIRAGTIGITVDGGGSVVTAGSKGFVVVPFACTITGWSIVADASGSVAFDIEKAADGVIPSTSIVASAAPALSSDQIERSTTLTGWTTAISANDVLEFEITGSPATITRATLQIHYQK